MTFIRFVDENDQVLKEKDGSEMEPVWVDEETLKNLEKEAELRKLSLEEYIVEAITAELKSLG